MHFVYIIYSTDHDKYYVGESVDPAERTKQHNAGFYKNASTSYSKDWELKLVLSLKNRTEALVVERHIKSMKSKVFVRSLIENTVFLGRFKEIILEKYKIAIE